MQELMLALMVWLSPQTGLPVPDEMPRVVMADPCEIERLVRNDGSFDCSSKQAINYKAAYDAGTMFLPDTWSASKIYDVSMLLHELVHHMQHEAGIKHKVCINELEGAAYGAQIAFLGAAGVEAFDVMKVNALGLFFLTHCEMGY